MLEMLLGIFWSYGLFISRRQECADHLGEGPVMQSGGNDRVDLVPSFVFPYSTDRHEDKITGAPTSSERNSIMR